MIASTWKDKEKYVMIERFQVAVTRNYQRRKEGGEYVRKEVNNHWKGSGVEEEEQQESCQKV